MNMATGTFIHNSSFSLKLINEPNKQVCYYTRLEKLARDKYSERFGQFVSYEGMGCFEYGRRDKLFTTLMCFVTKEWTSKLECFEKAICTPGPSAVKQFSE